MSRYRASAASAVLAAAFAVVAFGARGGTTLGRTTVVEVLLMVAGGALAAVAVAYAARGERAYGGVTLALFALLAGVTSLSVLWSITPDLSFVEAGRTLAYLAVFAGAVAAVRLSPSVAPVVLRALLLAVAAVCLFALASRIWPGAGWFDDPTLVNRLGQPFDYWNALAATAALAVPPALWLGSRRYGHPAVNALAYPLLGVVVLTLALTQSRGGVAAAAIGAVLWFAIVPLRLRSLPAAAAGLVIGGGVGAWALSKDAFSASVQTVAERKSAAGDFGLLVALMIALLMLVGLAVNFGLGRGAPAMRLRKRVGVAAVVIACLVPLVGLTSVAFSERGLGGTISDRVSELTNDKTTTQTGAARLADASSTRSVYWREADKIFKVRPGVGVGAGTFGVARLRFRKDERVTQRAHGYVPQTLADLGLLGLVASLALLVAWLAATGRATGLAPPLPEALRKRIPRLAGAGPPARHDWSAERVALVAVALAAIAFGLQSAIDWTWFVPGPAVMAIAAAGILAGRATLPVLGAVPAGVGAPAAGGAPPEPLFSMPPLPSRGRVLGALAVLLTAVLCAWSTWQPERSERATNDALELNGDGKTAAAIAKADQAHDIDPLTPDPLLTKAGIQQDAGEQRAARTTFVTAVRRNPGDPATWQRLASFESAIGRPQAALQALRGVLYLDPFSQIGQKQFLRARTEARQLVLDRQQRRERKRAPDARQPHKEKPK